MHHHRLASTVGVLLGIAVLGQAQSVQPIDPSRIPKFVDPLVIPPAMPKTGTFKTRTGKIGDYYEIAVRQFQQQILPARDANGVPFNKTTVWSYGSVNHSGTFNYPAFTIESKVGRPVRVKWINDLKNPTTGAYLPHLFAVDQTLHWANPIGGLLARDSRPVWTYTPQGYTGPVPMVTHVHGAHTYDDSDGYAEAWYLPAATNIPSSYAKVGTEYDGFRAKAEARSGALWQPGTSVYDYPNDQAASTLWYHDHTLGMTRLNVYAGPAGFYLLRGGPTDLQGKLPEPAPAVGDKAGKRYYEIPIAIQDRMFKPDGSLFYPNSRSFFDGITGPYMPFTDISPQWNPEFFGNVMVVNGKTWPVLTVEPRRYRFRMLNGCNSRFLMLQLSNPRIPMWQIGAEGGFLPWPEVVSNILMAPAERADVIIDFTGIAPGTEIILKNLGPDEPFGGGIPGFEFQPADPNSTGQVMKFRVGPLIARDPSTPVLELNLPAVNDLPVHSNVRQVALLEMMSMDFPDAPSAAMLGTMSAGIPTHRMWDDPISELPILGRTEMWEIYNFTADAHPIHLHQVQFQVVNRQNLALNSEEEPIVPVALAGPTTYPKPTELGYKDTVIAYPGQVTRLRVRFDLVGLFVWHCHIVEHEDNEMMRPLRVITAPGP